ncbi:MAG: GDSL-type esterase/lipase family protein [Proteobacteria bacterium]|nr:GDSL-type esterase/lipase family protein [Pseudomonadota bacterium]
MRLHLRLFILAVFLSCTGLSADAWSKPVILTVGDSLTFGLGVSPSQTWPALLEAKLRKNGFPDTKLINAGSSGATTAFGISTLKFHLKRGKPDLIIYALGADMG